MKLVELLEIPNAGTAGVRLGDDAVSHIPYTTQTDGRLAFHNEAWKSFHNNTILDIGHPVLIISKKTRRRNIDIMFVFEIIDDLDR